MLNGFSISDTAHVGDTHQVQQSMHYDDPLGAKEP
jgi:hypothetical protein